jgi:hypothetical protein
LRRSEESRWRWITTVLTSGHVALRTGISAPARRSHSCAVEVVGSLLLQPGAVSLSRLLRGARLSGLDGRLKPLMYVHTYDPCPRLHTSSAMPTLPPPAAKATRPLYHAYRPPACSSSAYTTTARSTSLAARTSSGKYLANSCLFPRMPVETLASQHPGHASSIRPSAIMAIVLYQRRVSPWTGLIYLICSTVRVKAENTPLSPLSIMPCQACQVYLSILGV